MDRATMANVFNAKSEPLGCFEPAFRDNAPLEIQQAYDAGKTIAYVEGSGWVKMPSKLEGIRC
jgi:hypothetical protein